jgi:hypothetical protein
MKTARAHRKFAIYSGFLDTILEGEEEVQDGETRKDTLKRILKDLEQTAAELKAEHESMRGVQKGNGMPYVPLANAGQSPSKFNMPSVAPPIEINLQHERIQIAIENAKTIEELKATKIAGLAVPGSLVELYNKKMEELTQ